MNHRRTPAPGMRPRGRFASGWCAVCGALFVLDRAVEPWSRARTCSESCRARLGNRGRTSLTCEHCVMVEGYHAERCRQEQALEDGGWRDEAARLVTFGEWLRWWEWSGAEEEQAVA